MSLAKSLSLSLLVMSVLAGCQSSVMSNTGKTNPALVNFIQELEGTQHKVWKEASFKGIRSELKEGELITFKSVEAKPLYNNSGYYYLGYIYSADGQRLFDKKYSLSDVGVLAFKGNKIDKSVNLEVVNSERGVRYHGNPEVDYGFSTAYWKSSGGDEPKAIPVRDYKSPSFNSHKVAENYWSGLHLNCIDGSVYVYFNNKDNIYAADNEKITVTVYFPYSEGKHYQSRAIGHTGVLLKVDSYIERILLEEDAIKLVAYSHVNRGVAELTAYNNGLAEAYARVNGICSV